MKVIVTEKIPGLDCEILPENKYECEIKENSGNLYSINNVSGVINTLGFINSIILILSFSLLIFLIMYRTFVKLTKFITNKDSGKKIFKYTIIIFIISLSIYSLGSILDIIAPWLYR